MYRVLTAQKPHLITYHYHPDYLFVRMGLLTLNEQNGNKSTLNMSANLCIMYMLQSLSAVIGHVKLM